MTPKMNITQDYHSNGNTVLVTDTWYTPELLSQYEDYTFVFSDNEQRTGTGGQAIIRECHNTFGVATKRKPSNQPESFMTDCSKDLLTVQYDLAQLLEIYYSGKTLVFPAAGLGTGLAQLPERAPTIFKEMNEFLQINFFTE